MSSYEPVHISDDDNGGGIFTIDDDENDDENAAYGRVKTSNGHKGAVSNGNGNYHDDDDDDDDENRILSMEVDAGGATNEASSEDGFTSTLTLFSWKDPWVPNMAIVCFLVVPLLLLWASFFYHLLGQWWIILPFIGHAWIALASIHTIVRKEHLLSHSCWRFVTTFTFWVDVILLTAAYPLVANAIIDAFWIESDGTFVVEYEDDVTFIAWMITLSYVTVGLRLLISSTALVNCCCSSLCSRSCCPRCVSTCLACLDSLRHGWTPLAKENFKKTTRFFLGTASLVAFVAFVGCIVSAIRHLGTWDAPTAGFHKDCDPLDTTECWLPFPSFHHMVKDETTQTGWRVNLHPRRLPPLKGRRTMDPSFLNELDGFSTMAPIMFYLDGLKEAAEAGIGEAQLMGSSKIAESVTKHSLTLLIDVSDETLVPHSAEIDYLDPDRPLVLIFPAQPLSHDHHYAVAVANGVDVNGQRLQPSPALAEILYGVIATSTPIGMSRLDPDRSERYQTLLIPLLEKLAPWLDLNEDPAALQLLFDFHTVSGESQLGSIRAVRDNTLARLDNINWNWMEHIEVSKKEDFDCDANDGTLLARTIYADMTIPWYLNTQRHRAARLDKYAVETRRYRHLGKVKFVVHIPCSVRNAIKNFTVDDSFVPVQAVLDYGHSLFYGLQESSDRYLQKIASDNRYVITAMDWRGMSIHDLLILVKVMATEPSLFESVRDNLIQGYAAKFALQHFTKNALFLTDWFHFENDAAVPPPKINGKTITRVFYGNSQGGILGAAYTALAGPKLIDRVILGVPGTPFSLIISRSDAFQAYDALLSLSFYNNRHIRQLLYLVQMAWDPTEGSGVLAPPLEERFPPTLLQAGLGDSTVPTQAAEALARGYGAVILPNNPRQDIYLIDVGSGAEEYPHHSAGPQVTLTEVFYAKEYSTLPKNDVLPEWNMVHECVRFDRAMVYQMTQFINTGTVEDVCANDACQRVSADCFS